MSGSEEQVPRSEYPRPQFVRKDWLCLNGPWEFEIDWGDSGLERGLLDRPLKDRILVPFCPESELSGIGQRDFMPAVWYRRQVEVPPEWAEKRLLLHFQACDYDTTVWVNGSEVGRHRGGFTPFGCDITQAVGSTATATIVVRARDDHRPPQPRGKQSQKFGNHGCFYTRTTGIWQTVWMEPAGEAALCRPRLTPDLANSVIGLEQPLNGRRKDLVLRARLTDSQGTISQAEVDACADLCPHLDLPIPRERLRLWSPQDPHLYGVQIELLDEAGRVLDQASSYAGMRSVTIDGPAVLLNGQVVFQRLVLDQGFYPAGIWTAPSDQALWQDIELSLAAGFNGARLHQKVFEERFLYHADRLGYLVWGEFGDWGCQGYGPEHDHWQGPPTYITQWLEVLERDYSHPCIIGWCPLNETRQPVGDRIGILDDVTRGMFLATKAMDRTRPVLDASGYSHRVPEADVYDCHDYGQDAEEFRRRHSGLHQGRPWCNDQDPPLSIPYRGQPFFVSEFGGIWWNPQAKEREDSWGYGQRPRTEEEFYERFERLCTALLDNPRMFGYCYTQLTDVFQEQNGIYTFDRRAKFDLDRIRRIQQRQAAIEGARADPAA
jgi:beta-galactosidase/beta-glucuronidase